MHPRHWASIQPQKSAIINSDTGESLSYGELDKRSNQISSMLYEMGLREGDNVAIFMENNTHFFEIIWAALSTGLYVTPINRFLTAEEAAYIIQDCDAKIVFTSSYLYEKESRMTELCDETISFFLVDSTNKPAVEIDDKFYKILDHEIGSRKPEPLKNQKLGSFMMYSSGTTGKPKGIKYPLKDIMFDDLGSTLSVQATALIPYDKDTIFLCPTPLYHSAAVHLSTALLSLGGTLVFMPKFDAIKALEAIEKYEVTDSWWVPTLFIRLLKLSKEQRYMYDLSSMKTAIHAAAPCPVEAKNVMMEWWGPIIYEFYGGTENNGLVLATPQEWLNNRGTVGKAIFGSIHICDEDGRELPNGENGIVFFEQPKATFSYHKDSDKTQKTRHPTHHNWSTLGDIGYVNSDDYLFLTDRKNFVIISGGVNIYPQELEDIMIMHERVEDVAVFGIPNSEMGEEVKAVVQVAVQAAPGETDLAALEVELIDFSRTKLAHYKCPKSIDFVDKMPRLPTGKLYKNELKNVYWADSCGKR